MPSLLSPIILSKNNATEHKTFIQASINNDVFDIYTVKNSSNNDYCDKLTTYLQTTTDNTRDDYYKCPSISTPDACSRKDSQLVDNVYLVIEFINTTSYIIVNNIKYMIRKMVFNDPSYHYVIGDDNTDANGENPQHISDSIRGANAASGDTIINCVEIEFMCSNDLGQQIIISTLCDCDKSINILNHPKESYTILHNYILNSAKQKQLKEGGYRDSTYTFNCIDFFPDNKHFYKYNGTTFRTNAQRDVKQIQRIIFEDSITIPKELWERIEDLTFYSNCREGIKTHAGGRIAGSQLRVNHFIHIQPEIHDVIYSDTNIDFISNRNRPNKKKDNIMLLYVILVLFILFLIIIVLFAWKVGILRKALLEIFAENEMMYTLIAKYI